MLVIFLVVVAAAAGVGGLFTARSVGTWYRELNRPGWTPPGWLFSPVWTALYVMMAIAAWRVWMVAGAKAPAALTAFVIQLVLNAGWSAIFFGLRRPGWAFAELSALWVAIVVTTVLFARRSVLAAVLMAPYLAWTTFAGALNFTIWRMNV
ncbi:MAG: TspO/MBR family protein [Phycisphaerae bacterium]